MNTKESCKSVLEVMAYLWLIQKYAPDKAHKEQKVQQLVDSKSTLVHDYTPMQFRTIGPKW